MSKIGRWNVGEIFELVCTKAVIVLGILIFGILTCYSVAYTEVSNYQSELFTSEKDSIFLNLLIFCIIVMVIFLLGLAINKTRTNLDKFTKIVLICSLLFVTVISLIWVRISHSLPYGDQAAIYSAANSFLSGDYGMLGVGGYMYSYPQQYGLVFFLEILFKIFGQSAYPAMQYFNALCMPLLVFAGYKIAAMLTSEKAVQIVYLIIISLYTPMFLYVPFVYGEISSITFTLVCIWQVMSFCKKNSWLPIIWATLAGSFACMVRKNSLIVMIASCIILLIYGIVKKNWKALIFIIILAVIPQLVTMGIKTMYENRSGMNELKGTPSINYIAMGMQEGNYGAGWYNHYVYTVFEENQFDYDATSEVTKEYIKNRLNEFKYNKEMAKDFYHRKILTQWNEPTCDAVVLNDSFDCTYEELPGIVQNIFWGKWYSSISNYMNRMQAVIYLGLMLGMIYMLLTKNSIQDVVLIVILIGGFLFSILWEAKSRYVLPYMIYMIPLAAKGICCLTNMIHKNN